VRPGQSAILVSQGRVADVYEPGQYSLETKNMPVLSTLMGWKYGFDSPFKAEVYFLATRQITDLKWGTPNPVMMRDPDFGPIRVRAFGTYTLKAVDPKILLEELVGTDSQFEADEITELLRSIVNTAFADVIAKSDIAILDLASNYQRLSEELRRAVIEHVDAHHHQWAFGSAQPVPRAIQIRPWRRRAAGGPHPAGGRRVRLLRLGDPDGHIHQHRPRLIVQRNGNRFVDEYVHRAVDGGEGGLCDGREQGAVIENLMGKGQRIAGVDAAGQEHQWYAILIGVGDHVNGVGNAGTDGRHQHAGGAAGMVASLGHEAGGILVLGETE